MAKRRARGEGSVYRYGNGWRGHIQLPDGRRVVRKASTQAGVLDKLAEAQKALATTGVVGSATATVQVYLERWLVEVEHTLKPETLRKYKVHVDNHLVPAIGSLRLVDLQPGHVRTLHRTLAKKKLGSTSQAHVHATLRRALNTALADGIVVRNAAALVPLPRRDTVEQGWLTPEEVRTLVVGVAGTAHEARVLVALLGLRQGEALGLQWGDFDATASTLTIRRALTRTPDGLALVEPKTPRSRRVLSLPAPVVEALQQHRVRQLSHFVEHGLRPELSMIFPDQFGELCQPNRDWRAWKEALTGAGVRDVPLHAARHSYATTMLVAGADIKAVADSLGHASLGMLHQRYSHVADEMRVATAETAGRALFGV